MSEIGGIDVPVDVQGVAICYYSLHWYIIIFPPDWSIPAKNNNYNVGLKFETLRHLLASASSHNLCTLNALKFPLAIADAKLNGYTILGQ